MSELMRPNDRGLNELRPVQIETGYIKHPEGSVLITVGDTKIICSATVENRVPPFMRNQGKGWITAEYQMLPRATEQRNIREAAKGKLSGRTMEIQRLIGRALRAVVDLDKLGERTLWIDCDVIQADGGTRTASITGAFVAMVIALGKLVDEGTLTELPITDYLAATSIGVMPEGDVRLDLEYVEDARAAVDMNVVMTGSGHFVEIQGTGEESTFSRSELNAMLDLAESGMNQLFSYQQDAIGDYHDYIMTMIEDVDRE